MSAKILIVDDDPSMRDTLLVVLEDEGFEVAGAANGYEAIEQIKKTTFDLVICDIRMAGMDGIDTLAALRKSQPELKSIVMTGYASTEDPIRAIKLGVDDYLYKPFDAQQFLKSVRKSLETARKKTATSTEQAALREEFIATLKRINAHIDDLDKYYSGHSKRVSHLSLFIFRKMSLPKDRLPILETASLLHDLGQIAIKKEIIHKKGEVTPDEYNEIKRHPQFAKELLQVIPGFQEEIMTILHHHERWDGIGYPGGLKGEDIPMESRIIAVVEAYDSLISDRPHRSAVSTEDALKELKKNAGTQFDPKVVEALCNVIESENPDDTADQQIDEEAKEEELSRQKKRKTLINLAHTFRELGQYKVALQAYEESLQMEEDTPDALSFEAMDGVAVLSIETGEISKAAYLSNKALSIAERLGKFSKALALCTIGLVQGEEGRWSESESNLKNAREIFVIWEDHQKIALADLYLSSIYSLNAARSPDYKNKFVSSLKNLINIVKQYDDYELLLSERKRVIPLLFSALSLEIEVDSVKDLIIRLGTHSTRELEHIIQSPVESTRFIFVDILEKIATSEAQEILKLLKDDPSARIRDKAAAVLSKVSGKPIVSVLKANCLGKFRLCIGETVIKDDDWKTKKAKYVMAYIISHWDEEVPEEKILYAFWPDSSPKKARQSLHTALYQIRQLFGTHLGDQKQNYLVHEKEFYRFNTDTEFYIDLKEFEHFYKAGSRLLDEGKEEEGIAQLQKAEVLFIGEFLEGYFSDWAIEFRENTRKNYIDILVKLAHHFFKVKKYEVCLDYSQKILASDSCRQDIHMMIMKCYQALGQKELAIRQYQQCTQVLKRELNISPSTELMALYLDLKG